MRLPGELRDLRVAVVAALTLVANLILQVPPPAAVLAAASVVVAFALFRRLLVHAGRLSRRELEVAKLLSEDALPGLTVNESAVARYVHRGFGDPAIARRLGISLTRVDGRIHRIQTKWGVSTRQQITEHVSQILGEPPERPGPSKQRWEWIAELGTGVAIMALGLGSLALSVDTPLLGNSKDWLGFSLLIGGLVFSAISTVTYFWERAHANT
jgi:DNA-binding CsgD family transcriptional regulator